MIARGVTNYGTLNLASDNDFTLYENLKEAVSHLIKIHRERGHDAPIDALKKAGITFRTSWQKGEIPEDLDYLETKILNIITCCDPIPLQQRFGETFYKDSMIHDYPIIVFGYMNRALPYVSNKREQEAALATYNSFKERPSDLSESMREKIKTWANAKYKAGSIERNMSTVQHIAWSMSAAWEMPRSGGGGIKFISDWRNLMDNLTSESLIREGYNHLGAWHRLSPFISAPMELSETAERIMDDKKFARALALDLLKPYLDHSLVCKRQDCQEPKLHLPILPIGIKERGAKVRVPCYTSVLLNILCEPIRVELFKVIRKDKRCNFSMGRTNADVKKFLRDFGTAEFVHSSDLTRSTDFITFDFTESLFRGLFEKKKIDETQLKISLLATGPMKIIEPSEENLEWKKDLPYRDRSEINETWKSGLVLNPKLDYMHIDMQPYMKGLYEEGLKNQKNDYYAHIFEGSLGSHKEGLGVVITGDQELRRILDPMPAWFVLKEFRKDFDTRLGDPPGRWYLTRIGMQMGINLSIAVLYLYNMYADDSASKVGKGMTLLCGDDALRAGDRKYIDAYRKIMLELKAKFSATKDVMGPMNKGLFTELHFFDNQILKVPKVKSLCRLKGDKKDAPGWITALQSAKSAYVPDQRLYPLKDLALTRYRSSLQLIGNEVPLGLPPEMGGFGDPPLRGANVELRDKILSIKDPLHCYLEMQAFTKSIKVETYTRHPRTAISLREAINILPPIEYKKDPSYEIGHWRWVRVAVAGLRAKLQTLSVLSTPPEPESFYRKETVEGIRFGHMRNCDLIRQRIVNYDLLDRPRSPEEYQRDILRLDVNRQSWYLSPMGYE